MLILSIGPLLLTNSRTFIYMLVIIFMCVGVGLVPDVYFVYDMYAYNSSVLSPGYNIRFITTLPRKFITPGPTSQLLLQQLNVHCTCAALLIPAYSLYVCSMEIACT